jgi:hypothetical protein
LGRRQVQNVRMHVEHRAVAATLTVLLHLLILSALLRVTSNIDPPPPPPPEHESAPDTLHGAGERIVSVDISHGLTTEGQLCAGSSYIGVGVTATPGTERVIMVGDNTPAARAGLQPGDIVLNPAVWRDAHEDGALIHLEVLRDGAQIALTILVGKICIGGIDRSEADPDHHRLT